MAARTTVLRWLAIGFLAALALFVVAWKNVYWPIPLLLLELAASPLARLWAFLTKGVDALRQRLAPLKRFPGTLVGIPLLLLGLAAGAYAPQSLQWLGDGVAAVIHAIARAAPYVIFFTLTPSIVRTLKQGRAGKFAGSVIATFFALGILAGLLSIILLVPILGLSLDGPRAGGGGNLGTSLLTIAFQSAPFLAIFVAVGTSLMIHGFQLRGLADATQFVGSKLVDLVGDVLKILMPLILLAFGVFIPTYISRAVNKTRDAGATDGAGWVGRLDPAGAYGVGVALQALILGIWLSGLALVILRYTHLAARRFFKEYFLDVFAYAWATGSSSATIPLNIERAGTGLGVRSNIREFVIPLGATIHLDGTIIGGYVCATIAAQLAGYSPSLGDLLVLLLPLTVATVGAPGIPNGLIFAAPILADVLPLTEAAKPAFIAAFVALLAGLGDQFRTGTNATGKGLVSRLFEHWYPQHFERYDEVTPAAAIRPEGAKPATS